VGGGGGARRTPARFHRRHAARWVASDFIRSTLDLFPTRASPINALSIAAGLPRAWFQGDGSGIDNLRTEYGKLSFTLVGACQHVGAQGVARLAHPAGASCFLPPWDRTPRRTLVNGRRADWRGNELRIGELPATY